MAKVATVTADPFQIAIAELAGLDPTKVLADSLSVEIEPGAKATVTARVYVPVDADEVVRLAVEHNRIGVAP